MTAKTLLARQPIFNQTMDTVAYELLFRTDQSTSQEVDGDAATSAVILNTFTEAPLGTVLDGKKAFVNFTRNLILNPPELDPRQVVIEVLEHVKLDDEVVEALNSLKKQGFTIALDDFEYSPQADKALFIADILKLDVLALNAEELQQHAKIGRQHPANYWPRKSKTRPCSSNAKPWALNIFRAIFSPSHKLSKVKRSTAISKR